MEVSENNLGTSTEFNRIEFQHHHNTINLVNVYDQHIIKHHHLLLLCLTDQMMRYLPVVLCDGVGIWWGDDSFRHTTRVRGKRVT